MTLTTTQIITLARAKLLEITTEIISDATILIYANLTYTDLIKRVFTNDNILSSTISFANGVGSLPVGFGTLYGSAQDVGNNVFEEVSIEDFDNKVMNEMVTIEGGLIKAYPSTTSSLAIKYYPKFDPLTTSQNPEINEYFHECIIYGILARAFEDLQDQELASFYNAKYEAILAQKSSIQSNYEEGNQRGGVMFTYQKLI